MKLLVAPLYGNDPAVGIRELFQNAIDSVREFEDILARHPELSSIERYIQEADVTLQVQCDDHNMPKEIVVTDRGMGMTVEIVRDYFLKAGASFRRSSSWRQDHENDDGHSRVLRTGRFGVGALAAFLLGDEITVTTRHAFSRPDDGVTFTARLDDDAISLNRVACPVGTSIQIRVPEGMRTHVATIVPNTWEQEISFDSPVGHYFLRSPSLSRYFSTRENLQQKGWLPQLDDDVSAHWRCFSTLDFEKIFWTYETGYPYLSSNGIIIENDVRPDTLTELLDMPNISVFDKDGLLPINLQRTNLHAELPFSDTLLRSIGEDLIAYALIEGPKTWDGLWFSGLYEGFSSDYHPWEQISSKWLVGREGFILNQRTLLAAFKSTHLLVIVGGAKELSLINDVMHLLPSEVLIYCTASNIFSDTHPRMKGVFQQAIRGEFYPYGLKQTGRFVTFVPDRLIEKIKTLRPGREVQKDLDNVAAGEQLGQGKVMSEKLTSPIWFTQMLALVLSDIANPSIFCLIEVNEWRVKDEMDPLADCWKELVDTLLIPFDAEKRQRLEDRVAKKIDKLLQVRRSAAQEKAKASNPELLESD